MSRFWLAVIAVPVFHLTLSTAALADAKAEKYVDGALPYMYLSCKGVVEEASGKEAYIDKVIRALVAVSLYNRNVDMAMFEVSEDAKTAMHDKFVEALKKGCAKDKNALLAGVIDQAVADALAPK